MNLLDQLMNCAAAGAEHLPAAARRQIADFLATQCHPTGGFRAPDGRRDLYYTFFGAAACRALGAPPIPYSAAAFANSASSEKLDFVHLCCLSALGGLLKGVPRDPAPLARRLDTFRSADGGFHHEHPSAPRGTAYGAYLAKLALDGAGRPFPVQACASLASLKARDGGLANHAAAAAGSTPATAAAVALLRAAGSAPEQQAPLADWLEAQATPFGGFRTGPQQPYPDLLATATALFALRLAGRHPAEQAENHADFVDSVWDAGGGFGASILQDTPDCEYTFYALLSLGALTGKATKTWYNRDGDMPKESNL